MDATEEDTFFGKIQELSPNIIINCIGILIEQCNQDILRAIQLNALLPHKLENLADKIDCQLIQMSTDCVFSGNKGNYTENDRPDPEDLYGKTKLLGEVSKDGSITLRTSIIGRELKGQIGLLEWFLAQRERKVQGYINAIFSGFTTLALSQVLRDLIDSSQQISGIHHVSSEPISKYDLLLRLREVFGLRIEIDPYESYHCDRSLDSSKFRSLTGFVPPTWDHMLEELAKDNESYQQWRQDIGS